VTNCAALQVLTPKLTVSKVCPANPVPPGGLLAFTGIVSNAGTVTITNVTVVNNQPTNGTPLIGPITLVPAQTASFGGSYTTPFESCGPWVDTLTAHGNATCTGAGVNATLTSVCPTSTTPGLSANALCPSGPVPLGQPILLSGTVSNSGNATLTNVTIVINQPSNNTPVFGPISLARGEIANFVASYVPPIDSCQTISTSILTVRANSGCSGANVAVGITNSCPVVTAPRLWLVKHCPANAVLPGGILTFTGTVSNSGNVTLTNVFVVNNQPSNNTPVLGPITLAPGAATNFTGSYAVCPECCGPYLDTLSASASDRCTGSNVATTATASCAGVTTPAVAVTKDCSPGSAILGQPLVFSGIVSNSGNVALNNVLITDNKAGFIAQIQAFAPGETFSYVASYTPTNCGPNIASTITVTGTDACAGAPITNSLTTGCAVACSAPQPVLILNPRLLGGFCVFSFLTQTGHVYTVQFTPSLSVINWQLLTNLTGDGSTIQIQDPNPPTQPQRFYRVLVQ